MPYTEKRGDGPFPWRVRWPIPGKLTESGAQAYDSASGFADEDTARDYGLDMESDLRRGRYRPAARGRIKLKAWAPQFLGGQNWSQRTINNRRGDLENHLLPAFGETDLVDFNWWLVSTWGLRQACARESTQKRISLLSQMLTAAVDADLIDVNPILRRKLGGTPENDPEKVWATPLQSVVIAERLGQLGAMHKLADGTVRRGRGTHPKLPPMFRLLGYVIPWTGMRSGEAFGLHRRNCGLWRRDIVDGKPWRRRVIRIDPDEGQLIDHYDRDLKKTRRYLGPPKPPSGPREIDLPPFLDDMLDAWLADWPHDIVFCQPNGEFFHSHSLDRPLRLAADGRPTRKAGRGYLALPAWEPICQGLTMHGWRHSQNTWMDEDGVREVARRAIMGHKKTKQNMQSRYAHVTPAMRKERVDAMQARYEKAQSEFGRMSDISLGWDALGA